MRKILLITFAGIAVVLMAAQTKPAQIKQAAVPKKTMDAGKKVYDTYCMACHQDDGGGVPRLNPPLSKTPHVLGDKKYLVQVVIKGMNEPLEVDGETYDNAMSAHNFLTDQEVADVLTYVRNSFKNKASIVTAAEVKAIRAKLK